MPRNWTGGRGRLPSRASSSSVRGIVAMRGCRLRTSQRGRRAALGMYEVRLLLGMGPFSDCTGHRLPTRSPPWQCSLAMREHGDVKALEANDGHSRFPTRPLWCPHCTRGAWCGWMRRRSRRVASSCRPDRALGRGGRIREPQTAAAGDRITAGVGVQLTRVPAGVGIRLTRRRRRRQNHRRHACWPRRWTGTL